MTGALVKENSIKLEKIKVPKIMPKPIGKRKRKLFLKSLKILEIAFIILS